MGGRVGCSLASKNDFLDLCFKHFVSKSHRFCDCNYCNYFKWVVWLKVNRVLFHCRKSQFPFYNATWNNCILIKCNFCWKCKTYLHLAFWRENANFCQKVISHKINQVNLTELSCKSGIYQERGPKGPDFWRGPLNYPWA